MRLTACALLATFAMALPSLAQPGKLAEAVVRNRYPLAVESGRLSGAGADVLQKALAQSQYVLIGEDHGIAQIPEFISGVCAALGPLGFHTMVVETGPLAARELERTAARDDHRAQVAQFEKKFPDSIAFFNMQEENDLLARCAQSATGHALQIWGIDQEFLGSAGLILTRILETHPGKNATAAAQRLVEKNDRALVNAQKSGKVEDLALITMTDDEIASLRSLLQQEGNDNSRSLLEALIKTRHIYQQNIRSAYYESNRERALLMKTLFAADYKQAGATPPKLLFKFGANHMYRGLNPLHSAEIGNYVSELAEGQGLRSLHVLILGVKGVQLGFSGIGKPYHTETFDLSSGKAVALKPLFDNLFAGSWTLFDVRPLRNSFGSLGAVDVELERIIFGFDFVVLIPGATASHQIQ